MMAERVTVDESGRVYIAGELVAHTADLPPDLRRAWDALRARVDELEGALPDPDKLEPLARWMDAEQAQGRWSGRWSDSTEVQQDLRRWAKQARALSPDQEQE